MNEGLKFGGGKKHTTFSFLRFKEFPPLLRDLSFSSLLPSAENHLVTIQRRRRRRDEGERMTSQPSLKGGYSLALLFSAGGSKESGGRRGWTRALKDVALHDCQPRSSRLLQQRSDSRRPRGDASPVVGKIGGKWMEMRWNVRND